MRIIGLLIGILALISCKNDNKKQENKTNTDTKSTIVESPEIKREIVDFRKINNLLMAGDIIFQQKNDNNSKLISKAMNCRFNNLGIIVKSKTDSGKYNVLSVSSIVEKAPLDLWVNTGAESKFVVMRLKDTSQFDKKLVKEKTKEVMGNIMKRPYDTYFEWEDDAFYPSELVWKVYQRLAGIQLCEPKTLGEINLTDEEVKLKMLERFRNNIPLEMQIINPDDILNSNLLEEVYAN